MKIKRICFLAGEYPTSEKPKSAVFYQTLVHQIAKLGIECRVIYPYPMNLKNQSKRKDRIDIVDDTHSVKVYRPYTISFGAKSILCWNTAYLTAVSYTKSAKKALAQMNWVPDVFYGHFISPAGIMAAKLSEEMGIPCFVAYGESQPWSINTIGVSRTQQVLANVSGFVAVSSKNKKELIDLHISSEDRVRVFPNGVDSSVFYKRDKSEARKKMGWDTDKFIVAFVGHFNERKGILRLDKAIYDLPDVYVAYAGSGALTPRSPNIIHMGDVAPEMMPWFLSAADIFVLPTLHEGCCNAIIEALACGLPVVSSDRDFNYDILSNENAILIDPENVHDIRNAILKLKNDKKLRDRLAYKSVMTAEKLDIRQRAKAILSWMEEITN